MMYASSQGAFTLYPRDTGLDEIFRRQVIQYPAKPAVCFGNQSLTYAELDEKASAWARRFQDYRLAAEEPVALLLEPGIEQIVVQLGILRAGGSCVPLDPAQPDARLSDMLQDLDTRLLVTTAQWQHRLAVENIFQIENPPTDTACKPVALTAEQRTHILHTSGTSGRPKAVQVTARGILRLALNREFAPVSSGDIWAHISNPTFDASLCEIFGALLNGATLVVVPKQSVIDPFALREVIRGKKITAMCMTTALFNLTALALPDAFKGVRHLLVGGEAANAHAMREVLAHSAVENLRNAYGPTECTVYATSMHITPGLLDGKTSVSIGRAIDNTVAFILDEQQRPVTEGQTGELYLGGDGLSRGYWKRDALNRERFITLQPIESQPAIRLYRTGDLAGWNADGTIDYLGRADNQIKLRGHRIELEEIEAVLLSGGMLQGAVVDYIPPLAGQLEGYLLAYIVPDHADSLDIDALTALLESRLPAYMLPRIQQVSSIPLNANGKADRNALKKYHVAAVQQKAVSLGQGALVDDVAQIWRDVLGVNDISLTDSFFDLGGSSLQTASLMLEITRRLKHTLPIHTLYEQPRLKDFAALVEASLGNPAGLEVTDTISALREDARLADDLEILEAPVPVWRAEGEGRIFVTGITGFLGAFFLHDLLGLDDVQSVACLVRARDEKEGLRRIRDNLDSYGLWKESLVGKIRVFPGDLSDPTLGLGDTCYAELASWASVIFHLGAHVNYTQPYSSHRAANIFGTLNILKFANTGRAKGVHYVSSIAAYGPTGFFTGTRELYEEEPLELHLQSLKYDTGYSRSQWAAEQLLWTARDKGMAVAIYRPGFIMGDSQQGIGNHKDFVARLIKGCVLLGAFPRLEKQKKEFVPVDYVSRTLLTIASDAANYGQAYNLVPLDAHNSIDLLQLFSMINQCGYDLELLPYSRWVQRLAGDSELSDNPLLPLLPMLQEPVYGSLTRWEVYENMPVYRTDNVKRVLGPDAHCPLFNKTLLAGYLESWRETGFLPPLKQAQTV